jgi:tetratricopeptide (TPR) repeat protein
MTRLLTLSTALKTFQNAVIIAAFAAISPALAEEPAAQNGLEAPKVAAEPAKEEAKPALVQEPDAGTIEGFTGSYLSGQFARDTGDIDGAVKYLSQAYRKDVTNAAIGSQLVSALVVQGQMDKAVILAQGLASKDDRDTLDDLVVVTDLVHQSKYEKADAKLDESFGSDNGQLWLPLLSAWVDIGLKKVTKPLTIEELPVTVGRAAPVVNYHLALINNAAGFKEAAAHNFKESIESPENPPTRVMQNLIAFYQQNGKPEELKKLVEDYLAANPEMADDALESPINTVQDGVAEVLFTMGSVMQAAGVTYDATIYYQLARHVRPQFPLAVITLADLYGEMGQYAKSNQLLSQVPAKSHYYIKSQLKLAVNKDKEEKTDEAISILNKLAANNPKESDPLVAKGDLLRVHKRFPEAADAYTAALQRIEKPTAHNWAIYYARGACYERMDRWADAETDLKLALELKPDQPDVLNYLGYSWLTRGEHVKEATAMLEKALQLRPNDPQILDSMGWAFFLLGEYPKAKPLLERAAELLPSDPTVTDHLGDVYWRLGRKTEAKFQWNQALAFSPDSELEKALNSKLEIGLPALTNAEKEKTSQSAELTKERATN